MTIKEAGLTVEVDLPQGSIEIAVFVDGVKEGIRAALKTINESAGYRYEAALMNGELRGRERELKL